MYNSFWLEVTAYLCVTGCSPISRELICPVHATYKTQVLYMKGCCLCSECCAVFSIEQCRLDKDRGSCRDFKVKWFFDMEYGGCSRFWYGGCEGNDNRFSSQEECKEKCVEPPGRGKYCTLFSIFKFLKQNTSTTSKQ